ncbi:MAG: Rieske 2Fe-2S domain-containing protein, partial [Myxococcales bacterium]|nr:Rieske 2Fe-2S domain-containing protein [Myxococcales bacterium]
MADDAHEWIDVAAEAEVTAEHPVVVRRGRQQLVVMRDEDGGLHALDNRCPHEGYPLAQGQVRGCTLTCAWHNFKFDLRDGRCLKGDEAVAVYPLRVAEGRVLVDPRAAVDEGAVARGLERLREGLLERRLGQAAREVVRLLEHGVAPERLAVEAACFDAARAEWGSTHALAVAADVLPLLPHYPGARAALPLMQALDLASETNVRRPVRPLAPPVDPGDDPSAAGQRLRAMVEDEQAEAAESLLRGALERGWGRDVLEPWLYAPCCDHFLSFGHPLIYQSKVFDLLDAAGWAHAATILPGHLWGIVHATREDTLPRWRAFVQRLDACAERLPGWRARAAPTGAAAQLPAGAREGWWRAFVHGDREAAFDAVVEALDAGHAPGALADVIAAAAAERLWRFDPRHHDDLTLQEGWLDVTHTMTFADAVHHAVGRYREPAGLRLLFQAMRFVENARTLDASSPAEPAPAREPTSADRVAEAVAARDPDAAVALAARYLADHGPDDALRAALADLPLRDLYTRPIIVAHAIKTGRVAFALAERLRGTPWTERPVLAFVRFAATPLRERGVAQLVYEAERLVVEGKVPR